MSIERTPEFKEISITTQNIDIEGKVENQSLPQPSESGKFTLKALAVSPVVVELADKASEVPNYGDDLLLIWGVVTGVGVALGGPAYWAVRRLRRYIR